MLLRLWVTIAVAFSEQLCNNQPDEGFRISLKNSRTWNANKLSSTVDLPIEGNVVWNDRARRHSSGVLGSTHDLSRPHRTFVCSTTTIFVGVLLGSASVISKVRHPDVDVPTRAGGLISMGLGGVTCRVLFIFDVNVIVIYSDSVSGGMDWTRLSVCVEGCVMVRISIFYIRFVSDLSGAKILRNAIHYLPLSLPNEPLHFMECDSVDNEELGTITAEHNIDELTSTQFNALARRGSRAVRKNPQYSWVNLYFIALSNKYVVVIIRSELHIQQGNSVKSLFCVYYLHIMKPMLRTTLRQVPQVKRIAAVPFAVPYPSVLRQMATQSFKPMVIVLNYDHIHPPRVDAVNTSLPRPASRPMNFQKILQKISLMLAMVRFTHATRVPAPVPARILMRHVVSRSTWPGLVDDVLEETVQARYTVDNSDEGEDGEVGPTPEMGLDEKDVDQATTVLKFVNLVVNVALVGNGAAKTVHIQVPIGSIAEPINVKVEMDLSTKVDIPREDSSNVTLAEEVSDDTRKTLIADEKDVSIHEAVGSGKDLSKVDASVSENKDSVDEEGDDQPANCVSNFSSREGSSTPPTGDKVFEKLLCPVQTPEVVIPDSIKQHDDISRSDASPRPFLVSRVPGICAALYSSRVHVSPTTKIAGARRRIKARKRKTNATLYTEPTFGSPISECSSPGSPLSPRFNMSQIIPPIFAVEEPPSPLTNMSASSSLNSLPSIPDTSAIKDIKLSFENSVVGDSCFNDTIHFITDTKLDERRQLMGDFYIRSGVMIINHVNTMARAARWNRRLFGDITNTQMAALQSVQAKAQFTTRYDHGEVGDDVESLTSVIPPSPTRLTTSWMKRRAPGSMEDSTTPHNSPPAPRLHQQSENTYSPVVIPHFINERRPRAGHKPDGADQVAKLLDFRKLSAQPAQTTQPVPAEDTRPTRITEGHTLRNVPNKDRPTLSCRKLATDSVKTSLAKELHRGARSSRIPLLMQVLLSKHMKVHTGAASGTPDNSSPATTLVNSSPETAAKAGSGPRSRSCHRPGSCNSRIPGPPSARKVSPLSAHKDGSIPKVTGGNVESQAYTSEERRTHDQWREAWRVEQSKRRENQARILERYRNLRGVANIPHSATVAEDSDSPLVPIVAPVQSENEVSPLPVTGEENEHENAHTSFSMEVTGERLLDESIDWAWMNETMSMIF